MLGRDVTVGRAGLTLALVTLVVTVAGGVVIRFADHQNFPTIGRGLWWSVQTVTTVGYGDAVPTTAGGRVVAAVVMLLGIAFIAVLTAVVTAAFIEAARSRLAGRPGDPTAAKLDEISTRLSALEAALRVRPDEQ
jgi:voltage-gated potassium channel